MKAGKAAYGENNCPDNRKYPERPGKVLQSLDAPEYPPNGDEDLRYGQIAEGLVNWVAFRPELLVYHSGNLVVLHLLTTILIAILPLSAGN